MSRLDTMSAEAVRQLFKQNSPETFLELLTFSHTSMTTLRLVNDLVPHVSRGDNYIAFPFKLRLPADIAEQNADVQIDVSNVDRRLVDEVRTLEAGVMCRVEIVRASSLDTVEVGPFDLEISSANWTRDMMSVLLVLDTCMDKVYPEAKYTPQSFPQLFTRG